MLAGVTNLSLAGLLAARALQSAAVVAPAKSATRARQTAASRPAYRISLSGGAAALRDVGGTVDQLSLASNTLAVAGASLKKIGSLLDQANAALKDSRSDDAAKQSALDAVIGQLDRVSASARFGRRLLFDGALTVVIPGAAIRLPAVSSKSLGAEASGEASLASATTGGANAITGGDASDAAEIVDRASSQIDAAQSEIDQFQKARIAPALFSIQSTLQDAAPDASSSFSPDFARTAALLARAQSVVQPERLTAAAGAPPAENVFALVA